MADALFQALDAAPAGNAVIGDLAASLMHGVEDAPAVLLAPRDFEAVAWHAYLQAVQHSSYWFSTDELLLIAEVGQQNVVILKRQAGATDFEYVDSAIGYPGPCCVVKLATQGSGRERSHFERVIPATCMQSILRAHEAESEKVRIALQQRNAAKRAADLLQ